MEVKEREKGEGRGGKERERGREGGREGEREGGEGEREHSPNLAISGRAFAASTPSP